jgi:cytochrome P450
MRAVNSVPAAPRAWPLVGHALPLLRDPLRFLTSLPTHGDLVSIRIGPIRAIVVCNLELTHQVLTDDRAFDKGGAIFERTREVVGNGLATCPRRDHRRQRRLVQRAFHRTRLPGYVTAMTEQITAGVESWNDEQVIDVHAEMMAITTRALVATMFTDTIEPHILRQTFDDISAVFAGFFRRIFMPPPIDRLPTPGNRRYNQANARLRHTIGTIIADYRASKVDHDDLLSILLTARDSSDGDGERGLSNAEITDQMMTFLIAGAESTAGALAWAVHLLAQHSEVQERVHDEVASTLAGTAPTYRELSALALTGRVLTETLRLYPSGWLLSRTAAHDTQLGAHRIPAGATIVISPYLLHHHPALHPDPDRFDPSRWEPKTGTQHPRDTYIPFGAGARRCIGDNFGILEATLALAEIVAKWRLMPIPGQHVRAATSLVLQPRGLRLRLHRRTPANPMPSRTTTTRSPNGNP